MLVLNNIEVKYKNVILVLKGMSLQIADNQLVCLLGSNGAGKTTTLKAISGLLKTEEGKVTDGSIIFNDVRIDGRDPEEIAKMGITQIMEGRKVLAHLNAEENLRMGAFLGNSSRLKSDLEMVYGYFPRLTDLRKKESGYLSGGEQQMLVMGRALMTRPKIMLLDEPSLGLAPLMVKSIYTVVSRIHAEQKTAILVVEQNAMAALGVASYGYIMENGRVVLDGPAEKLRENEDIKEFYLGLNQVGKKKSYKDVKHYKRRKRWVG